MKGYLNFPKALSFLEQYGKVNRKGESFNEFIEDIDRELLELFYHGIRVELITAYDSHIGTVYSVQGINLNYCRISTKNLTEEEYKKARVNALNEGVSDIINFIHQITDFDAVIQHIGTGGPNPELFNIQFSIN